MDQKVVVTIEDEPRILEEIVDFLEWKNFKVYGATDGRTGLDLILQFRPDVILCDIMMPEMDGHAVLAEVRRHSDTATIPFIFLTARVSMEDLRMGMTAGADDYVTKPFVFPDLLQAIESRLSLKQLRDLELYRTFSHQLVKSQERKNQNIAESLHDRLLLPLARAKLMMSLSQSLTERQFEQACDDVRVVIEEGMQEVDHLIDRLHPKLIYQLDLTYMVAWQIELFKQSLRSDVSAQLEPLTVAVDDQTKLTVFRIVDELFQNCQRHAQPDTVNVFLQESGDELLLGYEDDGVGFDLSEMYGQGTGLVLVHEYVQALAGEIQITSAVGAGTQIEIRFPLETSRRQAELYLNESLGVSDLRQLGEGSRIRLATAVKRGVFYAGLQHVLATQTDLKIDHVGEWSFAEGFEPEKEADLLLVDSSILNQAGLTMLVKTIKLMPGLRVVAVVNPYTISYLSYLLAFGIHGVVGYEASISDYIEMVERVMEGDVYVGDPITLPEIRAYQAQFSQKGREQLLLTPRESEILDLLLQGLRSREIAEQLFVSTRTIEAHRNNIMRKLGAKTQVDLARIALERGY